MTLREKTHIERLEERIGDLEEEIKLLKGLPQQVENLQGQLRAALEELKKARQELQDSRDENQELHKKVDTTDRGVQELLLAVCGNLRFGQNGMVQNLQLLGTAVQELRDENADLKDRQRTAEDNLKSLDGTRRWLRARVAAAATAAAGGIVSGIVWCITHIQDIKDFFTPSK